jgi:eukaryotic-like serine/threonine-protein kinase
MYYARQMCVSRADAPRAILTRTNSTLFDRHVSMTTDRMTGTEFQLIAGRFRLGRLIGTGANGQVWLASDERLQRPVAVKVLIPESVNEISVQRLEREARAAAGIQHPNVVHVFDYIEDGGRMLIVMEFVEGQTLHEMLAGGRTVPLNDAIELTAQICDGLAAAHRQQLIHRDLKPGNVIVTGDGVAKILDFGIARRVGRSEVRLTKTGAVIGTPQYMAPEQLTSDAVDHRADVYAAGLLLYEMLAGRSAFKGKTVGMLLTNIVTEPPDMEPLATRGTPRNVMSIVERALAKDPEGRWPDALSMANALRVGLYGDVILSRRTPTPTFSSALRTPVGDEAVHGSEQSSESQGPLRGLLAVGSSAQAGRATSSRLLIAAAIAIAAVAAFLALS